jgi:hypothetical protein
MIVRDGLHGLLNKLVTLVFETFAITKLASVDTATEVVVLGWRRRRSVGELAYYVTMRTRNVPVAIPWNDIVDADLLTDLFDSQVKSVSFELLRCHVGLDHGRETHEASCLVVGSIAPAVTLPTSLHAIGSRFSCLAVSILELFEGLGDSLLVGLRPRLPESP